MDRRKLILSERARDERRSILLYWKQRNKSGSYSKKLGRMFLDAYKSIDLHPESGQLVAKGVRAKLVAGYRIAYTILPTQIIVVTIWDPRKGPLQLDL